jgi:hypothetical protein
VPPPAPSGPELPVARDFFVDPRKPALPSAYGDDRLLVFRREPLAVVISWDLADGTWGDGRGVWLELIEPRGRLVARHDIDVQTGLATFEELPERAPLVPQLVRRGRVMTRGRAFSLGPLIPDEARYQMTVLWDEPLPAAGTELERGGSAASGRPMPVVRVGRARSGTVASSRVTNGVPSSRVERGPPSSRLR